MSVASGLRNPTAVEHGDVSSKPAILRNAFHIDESTLRCDNRRRKLTVKQQAYMDEIDLALSVMGQKSLFLAPSEQCPLLPAEVPFKESILTEGVQDDVVQRVEDTFSQNTIAAKELQERFQDKLPYFATWQRLHHLIPRVSSGSLFTPTGGQSEVEPGLSSDSETAPPTPTDDELGGRQGTFMGRPRNGTPTPNDSMHFNVPRTTGTPSLSFVPRPAALPLFVDYQPYAPNFGCGRLLNDAYFITAVAAVASHRHLLKSLFVSTENVSRGSATFQFYRAPHRVAVEPEFVTVDTLVPVTGQTRPHSAPMDLKLVFGRLHSDQDAWLVLLEKAYATFRGSYAALHGGDAVDALVHLTGGTVHRFPVSDVPHDEVWWRLLQATFFGDVMLAYTTKDASDVDWEQQSVVVQFACEYDTTVEIPQDLYSKLLGKAPTRGEVVRLIKVRRCYRAPRTGYSWDWDSAKWTSPARAHLGRHVEDIETAADSLSWWITLDEFIASYQTLAVCTNFPHNDILQVTHTMDPATGVNDVAQHAPVFSLSIAKKVDEVLMARKSSLRTAPSNAHTVSQVEFSSIYEVKVPPLDLGEETEDEDGHGSSSSGAPSPRSGLSGSMTFLDSIRTRSAAVLEIRVAVSPSQAQKPFQLLLYRTVKGKAIAPTTTVRDGQLVHQLPVHGRIAWGGQAAPIPMPDYTIPIPTAALSSAQSDGILSLQHTSYFAEVSLNEGEYNIVVVPDPLTCPPNTIAASHGPVLIAARQRQPVGGATAFTVHVGAVPHPK